VTMLYGSPDALPRFSANWEKHCLALGERGPGFESHPLPLAAIYILGARRPDSAPSLELLRPREALLSLVANTYANKILDREMRAREFEVLSRLVTSVPIRRVHPHTDPCRLDQLCRAIRGDLQSLNLPNVDQP
jgi:hypothetical protein